MVNGDEQKHAPELPTGHFLTSKSPCGNRVILVVIAKRYVDTMVAPPSYDNLISEIAEVVTLHYRKWVSEHLNEEVYAYVVYATALVSNIGISVMTEQGLMRVASDYKIRYEYQESLAQLVVDLRWSVADTPYCGDYQELFTQTNARLYGMMSYVDLLDVGDPAFTTHVETLYSILVSALNQFRQSALDGATRPMLYVDFGDMSDAERLWFIERCNTQERIDWYTKTLAMTR
jgi:hypothetical protein